jgi:hypothetical protein
MREAVKTLLAEVQVLREQLAALQGRAGAVSPRPMIPGAAPTDPKLVGMLRGFIQPSNDAAAVDRIAREVEGYVRGNPDLTRQAVDGWTRVLALGYGTPEAQRVGKELVERLKR